MSLHNGVLFLLMSGYESWMCMAVWYQICIALEMPMVNLCLRMLLVHKESRLSSKSLSMPAACFTHPEISIVGLTEPQAREKADKEGFAVSVVKTSFKANTKALLENEGDGLAKLIYRPDTGEILGVHIFGLHAADLIHEPSNAIALGAHVQDVKFAVHAHPTLSEVLDELFKAAKVNSGVSHSVNEPVAA